MYHRDIRNMPIVGASDQLAGLVSMPDVLQYARAFDIDEEVRRTWKEIRNFYDRQYLARLNRSESEVGRAGSIIEIISHRQTGKPRSMAKMRDDVFGESVNRFTVDGARRREHQMFDTGSF